jgi:hypothetical protein
MRVRREVGGVGTGWAAVTEASESTEDSEMATDMARARATEKAMGTVAA